MPNTAYLILENGKLFKGKSFGAAGEVTAEIVFTTGMTGYLETLTDQSYFGQIVVQTFPLIGNYGIIPSDFESSTVCASAYIVKHWCEDPSNFRSEGNLDTFLKERNIVGLYDIDTRTLTKTIRENGVMNGRIIKSPGNVDIDEIKHYKVSNAVASVSTKEAYTEKANAGKYKVALLDFGMKENIKRELVKRQCDVIVLPSGTSADEILALQPTGIMLSNGPGDPADNQLIIDALRVVSGSGIPIFGICLGHQLLALANGFTTKKMKYGHRGANQAVQDQITGKVYITSQNHGYAVQPDSIDKRVARQRFCNVNDKTCEGIEYQNAPAFSVQFHPEACSGPRDTAFLFDRFIEMMEVHHHAAR